MTTISTATDQAGRQFVASLVLLVTFGTTCARAQDTKKEAPFWKAWIAPSVYSNPSEDPAPNDTKIWKLNATDFFDGDFELKFCEAIEQRNSTAIQQLLESGGDWNRVGKHGMTLLYWAYLHGNLPAFQALLERGASPDVPLEIAVPRKAGLTHLLSPPRSTKGQSVVAHANYSQLIRPGFFESCITYTKEPNQRLYGNQTFAHYCVAHMMSRDQLSLLMKIISTGIDLDAKSDAGETACHIAAKHNPASLLILVVAGADPTIPFPDGRKLVDVVREKCNPATNPLSYHYRAVLDWLEWSQPR